MRRVLQLEQSFHPWVKQDSQDFFVHTYPEIVEADELDGYFQASERFLEARTSTFACVADLRNVHPIKVTATHRAAFSNFEERVQEYDRRWCVGTGLVIHDAIHRGLITAVYWLSPPAYPYSIFGDYDDACEWALAQQEPTD